MSERYRPLGPADAGALARFLAEGMPFDAYLADALDRAGTHGFAGAFDGDVLTGVVLQRKGGVSAAWRTSPADAPALLAAVGAREPWTSVVGPEAPCDAIVAEVRGAETLRVDRVQSFMAVRRGDPLGEPHPLLRRATSRHIDALVPLVARYRVEDGLSRPADDHAAWIRAHTLDRIREGNLFVVEEQGAVVFTGAFNFAGRTGAGLGGIYTVPEARGRGLARRATAAICRIALERAEAATLHVDPRNAAAIRAYEGAGLRRHGDFRLTFR